VNLDLGKVMIWMVNISSMTIEFTLKAYKHARKSKTQKSKSPEVKTQTKLKPLKPRHRDR